MTIELDTSAASAARALQGILWGVQDTGEYVEVSVKSHGDKGSWKSWHLPGPELWDARTISELGRWSSKGRDVYFSAVGLTGKPDQPWRRGGAGLRGTAGALWIDVDCKAPGRDDDEHFEDLEDAVTRMDNALRELGGEWGQTLVDSALVIGSGWGVQYWFPLRFRVPGVEASRLTRVLCGALPSTEALGGNKIDRLWDVTRVFRMPGTWNWRAGGGAEDGRPTGVARWPATTGRGGRLSYENIVDILHGDGVAALGARAMLDLPETVWSEKVDKLLEKYCGVEPAETREHESEWWWDEGPSLEDLAERVWTWEEILEPHGWRRVSAGTREDVWLRPGKEEEAKLWKAGSGERSAVVYADKPALLVVYSDSPETGFSWGLRGGGRRGDAAGVGVVSKWRAWVDLEWGGDWQEAAKAVWEGEAGELSRRWGEDTAWMQEAGEVMSRSADWLSAGEIE
jgi:hypothetical protein